MGAKTTGSLAVFVSVLALMFVSGGCDATHGDRRQKVAPDKLIDSGAYTLTRVAYPASGLVILYAQSSHRPPIVFGIVTTSRRYHTRSGLRVGSTLADARKTPGIRCYSQVTYFACQGGLGYEKPVTSFTVRNRKVVRVFMAAVAD